MGPKGNSKVDAGRARKADAAAQKSAKEQAMKDAQVAASWNDGANVKRQSKEDDAGTYSFVGRGGNRIQSGNYHCVGIRIRLTKFSKHPCQTFSIGILTVLVAAKADAEARKRQEKAALLAQEEAALGAGGKPKPMSNIKKAKGGKKDDLSLLLVHAAEKTSRQKKQAELEKKRKEEK